MSADHQHPTEQQNNAEDQRWNVFRERQEDAQPAQRGRKTGGNNSRRGEEIVFGVTEDTHKFDKFEDGCWVEDEPQMNRFGGRGRDRERGGGPREERGTFNEGGRGGFRGRGRRFRRDDEGQEGEEVGEEREYRPRRGGRDFHPREGGDEGRNSQPYSHFGRGGRDRRYADPEGEGMEEGEKGPERQHYQRGRGRRFDQPQDVAGDVPQEGEEQFQPRPRFVPRGRGRFTAAEGDESGFQPNRYRGRGGRGNRDRRFDNDFARGDERESNEPDYRRPRTYGNSQEHGTEAPVEILNRNNRQPPPPPPAGEAEMPPKEESTSVRDERPPRVAEHVDERPPQTREPREERPPRPQEQGERQGYQPRQGPPASQRAPNRGVRRRIHVDEAEVMALFEHHQNQQGISFDKYDSIQVEIAPHDTESIKSFDELNVNEAIMENLKRCGYVNPTPVQKYGIPVALAGKDLMACAQTGSGKTAAFLIPIVDHILTHGISVVTHRPAFPIALIMAPTRELALQIFDDARKICFKTDILSAVIYGGTDYGSQFESLSEGVDIVVATPGRLKDMFERSWVAFERIRFLVLDEADRMLEMGFEEQIEYIVASRFTDMPSPESRQTMMYSATFPRPIQILAKRYMKKASTLLTVGRVGSTTKSITQRLTWVEEEEKKDMLLRLLYLQEQTDLVLIFVETKREADALYTFLEKQNIPCQTIHGDRKQWERENALNAFKSGEVPILVATDVASRGLDIPNVAHVIQYDMPQGMEDYTHRIGRTGRAGNVGVATAFFNEKSRAVAAELANYLQEHEQTVPDFLTRISEEGPVARGRFGGGRGGGRGGRRFDDDRPHGGREEGRRGRGGRGGRGGHHFSDEGESRPSESRKKEVVPVRNFNDGGI